MNNKDEFSDFLRSLLTGDFPTGETVQVEEKLEADDIVTIQATKLAREILESETGADARKILSTALAIVLGTTLRGEPHAIVVPTRDEDGQGVVHTFIGDTLTETFSRGQIREVLQLDKVSVEDIMKNK